MAFRDRALGRTVPDGQADNAAQSRVRPGLGRQRTRARGRAAGRLVIRPCPASKGMAKLGPATPCDGINQVQGAVVSGEWVVAPLTNVAVHVVDTPGVGGLAAHSVWDAR